MYKFSAETLELFRVHQYRTAKHLDQIQNLEDREEIDRARALFAKKNQEASECKECKENLKTHGFVCNLHYHDYCNQGPGCCWTCYVMSVHSEQLGICLD
jgi:hypothetical protein